MQQPGQSNPADIAVAISIAITVGWLELWLVASWLGRVADRGDAIFGGAGLSLDPERLQRFLLPPR